jgi:hypothetical protein
MGHISENKQTNKIIGEINEVAWIIPEKIGAGDALKPFPDAAMDALKSVYPNEMSE